MDKVDSILHLLSLYDCAGIVVFMVCWFGYRHFAERGERGRRGLVGITHEYRMQWAIESAVRDIPVACASLTANLMKSVSFYASTTIYIIAGLMALVGTADRLALFAADLPFAQDGAEKLLPYKLILLVVIFIVAYFKFTWSLRQFNFLCILIGGMPHYSRMPSSEFWLRNASRMARMNSCAGNEFNRGIRAYYYGIAALGWFLHPVIFIASTIWVTWVLYQRDYHSPALKILRDIYPPEQRDAIPSIDDEPAKTQAETAKPD